MNENMKMTEHRNPATELIDTLSTDDILQIINNEDRKVAEAIAKELPVIAAVVDRVVASFLQGGRLFYVGSGTSGRLGVLDAAECPPTFSTPTDLVQGIIAGGTKALITAVEGAEDDEVAGAKAVQDARICDLDTLIGISASGTTPFVLAAVSEARARGAQGFGITCNRGSALSKVAEQTIEVVVGAEVLSGSTRMKAGTAQKMILNMITTTSMIKLGKTYSNWMVDLRATNRKLKERAVGIVQEVTSCQQIQAHQALEACDWQVKTAILIIMRDLTATRAQYILAEENGFLRRALEREV